MRVSKIFFFLFSLIVTITFSGCEERDPTAMHKVHWDRDMCERCKMVVSERHHAVQVIDPQTGRSYMFDDIGCTVLWFQEEKIEWETRAIIKITDIKSGEWIDARTAFYDTYNITPMAYGLGAHKSKENMKPGLEILDYHQMIERVNKVEARNLKKSY